LKRLPHFTWNVSTLLFLVAISVSLVFVAGCTSNAVAPTSNNYQDRLDWANQFLTPGGAQRGSTPLDNCVVLYDTLIVNWVGYSGASFKAQSGSEKIDFSVPKGALYLWTQLTIRVTKYRAPFGSFWLLDCGPEGTRFIKPLEVDPNGQVTNNSVAVLFYFNPATGQWEVQQIAASSNSGLSIYHFSKYGIAD
jgi:hypothetical protein